MTQDTGMDVSPSWAELHRCLDDLQQCEAHYRAMHDLHGGDSMAAGQAWDRMRSAGHRARQVLGQGENKRRA